MMISEESPQAPSIPTAPTAVEPATVAEIDWLQAAASPTPAVWSGPRYRKADRTRLYLVVGMCSAAGLVLGVAIVLAISGQGQVASRSDGSGTVSAPIRHIAEEVLAAPPAGSSASAEAADVEQPLAEAAKRGLSPPGPAACVDLLGLIDPARDAIGAPWTRQGSSLACAGGPRWALVVPRPPPAGYRWTIVAERLSAHGGLNLVLIVDGRAVMAVLEGNADQRAGLSVVKGRITSLNGMPRGGPPLLDGPTTVVCTVTRSTVEVSCNGKRVIPWQGSSKQFSLDRAIWPELSGDRLAVTSYLGGAARIDKMELEEIDGGEPIDHAVTPPPWVKNWPPQGPATPAPTTEKSTTGDNPSTAPASIPAEQLSAAVRQSKESVCIIEHPLGSGSGFVVGKNLVATNAHVVDGVYVAEIQCHFSADGIEKCRASRILYEDTLRDLCLLEVETEHTPIPLASEHVFTPGEKVIMVGNPALGRTKVILRDAVTEGTIQAVVHTAECDFYQIDGAVNSGSSGGPALNDQGAVVGVIAMKATEQGESEIRQALGELDSTFSGRFASTAQRGIAFGIPVNDLSRAIEEVRRQPESAAARVGDRHMAIALLGRMAFTAGIELLKLQISVPRGVRQQAAVVESKIRSGTIPAATLSQMTHVRIIPESTARSAARELANIEVQKFIRTCQTDMEKNVQHLGASEHLDPSAARGLQSLYRSIQETRRLAENPPSTYQAFAQAVNRQTESLKDLVIRLEEQLEVGKAAYDD